MSLESSAVTRTYFPHVNLLRAFAALSVFVYHVIEHYGWSGFPIDYGLIWFRMGWMSVDLFFVISGFVIGWSLIQLHGRHTRLKPLSGEFLWRRAGRIIPLYLLTMLVFALLVEPRLFSVHHIVNWLAHFTFTHPFHPQTFGSINGINWTIGVEVHFYLFALITSPWWVRRNPLTVLLTGILIAWLMRYGAVITGEKMGLVAGQIFPLAIQMPMMLDEFAAGMALALLIKRFPLESWRGSKMVQGLLLGGLSLALLVIAMKLYWMDAEYWSNPNMVIFWRSSIAIAFASLLAFFIWLPPLKNPPMLYRGLYYLGDISYGIYLWHVIVIELFKPHLIGQPSLYLLATMPVTLLLAAASWHWLEKPLIKWSKARSLTSRNS